MRVAFEAKEEADKRAARYRVVDRMRQSYPQEGPGLCLLPVLRQTNKGGDLDG